MVLEANQCTRGKTARFSEPGIDAIKRVQREFRGIAPSLPSRRKLDLADVQSVVQIFSKFAFSYRLSQRPICRGNDTNIDLVCLLRPKGFDETVLQHPEEFGLRWQRQLPFPRLCIWFWPMLSPSMLMA
jgi:hypothetical protein